MDLDLSGLNARLLEEIPDFLDLFVHHQCDYCTGCSGACGTTCPVEVGLMLSRGIHVHYQ